jgi:hypothetical protein
MPRDPNLSSPSTTVFAELFTRRFQKQSRMTELAFHDKIGTNYAPLPFEIAQIRQLLAPPSREIERIDHEIALLQARRQLSAYVADHEALIFPIRQLPVDIIREIFIACIPKIEIQ